MYLRSVNAKSTFGLFGRCVRVLGCRGVIWTLTAESFLGSKRKLSPAPSFSIIIFATCNNTTHKYTPQFTSAGQHQLRSDSVCFQPSFVGNLSRPRDYLLLIILTTYKVYSPYKDNQQSKLLSSLIGYSFTITVIVICLNYFYWR